MQSHFPAADQQSLVHVKQQVFFIRGETKVSTNYVSFFLARPISLLLKNLAKKGATHPVKYRPREKFSRMGTYPPKKWCSLLAVGAAPRTINYVNIGRYRSEECSSVGPPPLVESGEETLLQSIVCGPPGSVIAAITPWGVGGGEGGAIKEISNNDIAARAGCGRGGPALSNLPPLS